MHVVQTMALSYNAICQGERPWTALGDFLNEWWDYTKEDRNYLIAEAIIIPPAPTTDQMRWAAFCLATVEWLCLQDHRTCPVWVQEMNIVLSDPWYLAFHPDHPAVQNRLKQQTPMLFQRRNIYGGNRLFVNKYAWTQGELLTAQHRPPSSH